MFVSKNEVEMSLPVIFSLELPRVLLPGLADPDPALEAVALEDAVAVVVDDIESFPPLPSSFPPPTPEDPDVFGALELEDVFCFFRFVSSSLSLV